MIQYKHAPLAQEYEQLKNKNMPLAVLLDDLAAYIESAFEKNVIVTSDWIYSQLRSNRSSSG